MNRIAAIALALAFAPAAAQVYKCDTPGGGKVFQQQPCTGGTQVQSKSESSTPYRSEAQVTHCRKHSREFAKWVMDARRSLRSVGSNTQELQKMTLAENRFADTADRMSMRAGVLLTTEHTREEVTAELYAVCMGETWPARTAGPTPR